MKREILKRIEINPKIMLGKPVIRGTRITVEIVLKKLSEGISVDEVLADFPRLTRDDIKAAVMYAAQSISTEETIPIRVAG